MVVVPVVFRRRWRGRRFWRSWAGISGAGGVGPCLGSRRRRGRGPSGASRRYLGLFTVQAKCLVWARKAMRGARKLGVEQTGVLLTYWQRLKRTLGAGPSLQEAKLRLSPGPQSARAVASALETGLSGRVRQGSWVARRPQAPVKTEKKLSYACAGRVYPDQKLG